MGWIATNVYWKATYEGDMPVSSTAFGAIGHRHAYTVEFGWDEEPVPPGSPSHASFAIAYCWGPDGQTQCEWLDGSSTSIALKPPYRDDYYGWWCPQGHSSLGNTDR